VNLHLTVLTAFIHLIKPGLTEYDKIELDLHSNSVIYLCIGNNQT